MMRSITYTRYYIVLVVTIIICTTMMYAQEPDTAQARTGIPETGDGNVDSQVFAQGDALKLTVYPDTAGFPNGLYKIDDKGYVDFPIIGYKKVTDKTVEELESLLKTAYVDYLPQPNLQVRPLIRVSLLGGFYRPGLYFADPRESMWNLIERGGGTTREDGIEKLKWKRGGVVITNDCVHHFESGQSLLSIGFKSGDRIQVTQRPKQRGWDVFRTDVLPMLTITLSSLTTAATAYMAYEAFKDRR